MSQSVPTAKSDSWGCVKSSGCSWQLFWGGGGGGCQDMECWNQRPWKSPHWILSSSFELYNQDQTRSIQEESQQGGSFTVRKMIAFLAFVFLNHSPEAVVSIVRTVVLQTQKSFWWGPLAEKMLGRRKHWGCNPRRWQGWCKPRWPHAVTKVPESASAPFLWQLSLAGAEAVLGRGKAGQREEQGRGMWARRQAGLGRGVAFGCGPCPIPRGPKQLSVIQLKGSKRQVNTPAPYPNWAHSCCCITQGKGKIFPFHQVMLSAPDGATQWCDPKLAAQLQMTNAGISRSKTRSSLSSPSPGQAAHGSTYFPLPCSTHLHPPQVPVPTLHGQLYLWDSKFGSHLSGQHTYRHWPLSSENGTTQRECGENVWFCSEKKLENHIFEVNVKMRFKMFVAGSIRIKTWNQWPLY